MASSRSALPTVLLLAAALCGCGSSSAEVAPAVTSRPATAAPAPTVAAAPDEGETCRARIRELESEEALPGAPGFEANRIAILGRAQGEPMVFVRAPVAADPADQSDDARRSLEVFAKGRPGGRVLGLVKRHKTDKPLLRSLLLRQGYVYAEDPQDALSFAAHVKLTDLFDDPKIFVQRGSETHELARVEEKRPSETHYKFAGGIFAGQTANLQLGDRLALTQDELSTPLHRDLAALAEETGFERAKLLRMTEHAIVADLQFGARTVRALIETKGAAATLACIAEDEGTRQEIAAYREEEGTRLRALASIRDAVTTLVHESMRFDRPFDEKGPDKDGQLRPAWTTAYLQGRTSFGYEGHSYPVFNPAGRAWPPEVCVDFVLDSYERAGGTWYSDRDLPPGRVERHFAWVSDVRALRGVIGFGETAEKHPELFEVRRFQGNERIQFGERQRFFDFLATHTHELRAGDVVAIHGLKRDDRIHQHAILVERTDPITGFAYGLADQMRRPRRRTWEGIMAEAPKRSLLFRVRPKDVVFDAIDPAGKAPDR
ncbi:MAG: hypothetical protein R3B70_19175 [Polyangiaceae bacterium]